MKIFIIIVILLITPNLFGFNLIKIELISCYDGDTCKFNILDDNFPSYLNPMLIRVYGVDTPELKGKNTNKKLAIKAKNFTTNFVRNATNLQLINCIKDKYFRFNCTYISDSQSLADLLIKEKLGKPYFGGKKVKS